MSGGKQTEEGLVEEAGQGSHLPGGLCDRPRNTEVRGGHSHGPVVPVHEDEEHGRQEEENGQDDDRHLGERGQA